MNYTKGEWRVKGCSVDGEDGYPIASTYPDTRLTSPESLRLKKANAHLIAAAPDMYEALKRLLKMVPEDCGGCIKTETAWIEAQEALAKAEGKE